MSRLIDADELIVIGFDDEDGKSFDFVPKEFIDNAPTVNAVEVVRCKECKHLGNRRKGNLWCNDWCTIVSEDDFCSWGEKDDGRR